jgi:pimeloyl-ACP methyl ester carboxylesterase
VSFRLEDMRVDLHGQAGPGRPWLLLVHGFLSSRAQWRPNLAALGAVAAPVTIELLGHGRSDSPAGDEAYTVGAYLSRFEALRRRLGAERWVVCGQSFGAGLTIRYALEHPERVIGQVFTNSVSGLSPPMGGESADREARAAALEAGGRPAVEALPFYPRPSRRLPPAFWEDLVADGELIEPAGIARALRATVPGLSVAADLGRIAVPTLLVNGMREAAFQPLRDLAVREIPGLEVVDVPAGGHSVNLDSAAAFDAAVCAFLARLAAVEAARMADPAGPGKLAGKQGQGQGARR